MRRNYCIFCLPYSPRDPQMLLSVVKAGPEVLQAVKIWRFLTCRTRLARWGPMSENLVSYNREDMKIAQSVVDGMTAEGFNVWVDQNLQAGENYDEITEAPPAEGPRLGLHRRPQERTFAADDRGMRPPGHVRTDPEDRPVEMAGRPRRSHRLPRRRSALSAASGLQAAIVQNVLTQIIQCALG